MADYAISPETTTGMFVVRDQDMRIVAVCKSYLDAEAWVA